MIHGESLMRAPEALASMPWIGSDFSDEKCSWAIERAGRERLLGEGEFKHDGVESSEGRLGLPAWTIWTVAISGVNCRPDNPGPGCAVARCLRESGVFKGRLIALGYDVLDAGLHDRDLFDAGYLLPYPAAGAGALSERLLEIMQCEGIDAIIPCLDSELANYASIRCMLEERGAKMLIPEKSALTARDKDRLPELCEKAGAHTPQARRVSDAGFFDRCHEASEGSWSYPLVVKGVFYDAYVCWTPAEAASKFHKLIAQWGYPALVQQYVAGEEVNMVAIGDGKGGMLGEVMMRKQAVTDKGKAWSGVAIDDPDLAEAGRLLMKALAWRGPLEFEMLREPGGRLSLVEINPRFPAWTYLSHGVGRNLPAAVLSLLSGQSAESFEWARPRPGTSFLRRAVESIVEMDEFAHASMSGETGDAGQRKLALLGGLGDKPRLDTGLFPGG